MKKLPVKKNYGKKEFMIVGIGTSAGGFLALEQFFTNMPPANGMAFVVIQHLNPDHKGILPELLQRSTSMKVVQATNRIRVEPDSVYVIPPGKNISLINGKLHLSKPDEARGLRLPVDYFFTSLAKERKDKSIGIILSGMGSDGSEGVKAIKNQNGLVLVQEPGHAKFDDMPRAAIAAVKTDAVARAMELPARLIECLSRRQNLPELFPDSKGKTNLEKILLLLHSRTGHDFSLYKKNTLLRRIERRMNACGLKRINSYVGFLQNNPKETEILFKELLIAVTDFFRDNEVWEQLKNKTFPQLFARLPDGYNLRAWVPACSTGEEAYSLAMIFSEAREKIKRKKNFTLQIFATDLDSDVIFVARKGFFNAKQLENVSPKRVSRFFSASEKGFVVKSAIRQMVVFAPHNITKDPPFTKLDILTCRNLLIYFEPELQKPLMALFHYSLKPEGILVLGTAETDTSKARFFDLPETKLKIYRRSAAPNSAGPVNFPNSLSSKTIIFAEEFKPMKATGNIQAMAEQLLLKQFAPASVIVNANGDILNITGRTGKYLEPAAGKANMNIHAMARLELRNHLAVALHKAKLNFRPHVMKNVKIENPGISFLVDVTIQQIEKPGPLKGFFMIVFTDVPAMAGKTKTGKALKGHKKITIREQELKVELNSTLQELQSLREEMQTSQEELKSTNEELQSSNEELQSTNEELTTSREEMQSMNEEMQTVNAELQNRVNDFIQANDDLKNLLNSTDIATLFLDRALSIRRFTDKMQKIIKIRDSDIGRPFTDLVSDLDYPQISTHAREVLRSLVFIETPIAASNGRWFNVRIMPYRTNEDKIDGVVITFIDITASKKTEAELNKAIGIIRKNKLRFP